MTWIISRSLRKRNGETVWVPGVVVRQRPPTAKGFVFLAVEEEGGLMNVIVKPDAYQRCYKVLRNCFPLMVDGTILGPTIPASAAVGDARFRGPPSQILAHARSRQRGTAIWRAQRTLLALQPLEL